MLLCFLRQRGDGLDVRIGETAFRGTFLLRLDFLHSVVVGETKLMGFIRDFSSSYLEHHFVDQEVVRSHFSRDDPFTEAPGRVDANL